MSTAPVDWEVVARNLPEHARNRIHTDEGARAAGFPRALVAGVTTYAYLTHPLLAAWGTDWLAHGGGEVRFRRPVFDGDTVLCRCTAATPQESLVEAVTAEAEQPRATFRATTRSEPLAPMRPGEDLPVMHLLLEGEWGPDYGRRAGDPLTLCMALDIAHPAVWPALANHVVHRHVARGAWIHTRSIVRHHGLGQAGAMAEVRSRVVRRFESFGERAVLDVHIEVVASLEHEAIIALP